MVLMVSAALCRYIASKNSSFTYSLLLSVVLSAECFFVVDFDYLVFVVSML